MDLSSIDTFIQNNLIPAKQGRKCFSGRYSHESSSNGMIARPGADFGYIMAMLGYNHEQKLGMTVIDCISAIYNAVIKIDGSFYMHSNNAEDPDKDFSIECRHIFNAIDEENTARYGVNHQDIKEAINIIENNSEFSIQMETLEGSQNEEGLLIINDQEYSVNSNDGNKMYFIYDKKRDDLFMKRLIEELNMENVIYEDFQRIATMQLSITLQIIAKDLPIFELNLFDPSEPHAVHKGVI